MGCWLSALLCFQVNCHASVVHHLQACLANAEAEGALEAFVSVISGQPGPRPEAIFDRVSGPILLLWGERDEVTPLDGPVAKFMRAAADSRLQTQFKVLSAGGHCLHDEIPQRVNAELMKWLQEHHMD